MACGVLQKRLAWALFVLLLSTLVFANRVDFELFCFINFPILLPPPQSFETNSLVEEFMLLANVSVAEQIHHQFPQCAILRRHPVPPETQFRPLLTVAKGQWSARIGGCHSFSRKPWLFSSLPAYTDYSAAGFEIDTACNKSLADSLDKATVRGYAVTKKFIAWTILKQHNKKTCGQKIRVKYRAFRTSVWKRQFNWTQGNSYVCFALPTNTTLGNLTPQIDGFPYFNRLLRILTTR